MSRDRRSRLAERHLLASAPRDIGSAAVMLEPAESCAGMGAGASPDAGGVGAYPPEARTPATRAGAQRATVFAGRLSRPRTG